MHSGCGVAYCHHGAQGLREDDHLNQKGQALQNWCGDQCHMLNNQGGMWQDVLQWGREIAKLSCVYDVHRVKVDDDTSDDLLNVLEGDSFIGVESNHVG